jgi:hypothetical protein
MQEFEEALYTTVVHNLELDEIFFVSQFITWLKGDI